MPIIRVFISHSSTDTTLAKRFVRAMRAAIRIPVKQIRCTSLPQYSLPVGSRVSSRLRQELEGADVVVGLVTIRSTTPIVEHKRRPHTKTSAPSQLQSTIPVAAKISDNPKSTTRSGMTIAPV